MPNNTHRALRCTALQVLLLLRLPPSISWHLRPITGNLQWDRIIPKSFVDYWRRLEQQVFAFLRLSYISALFVCFLITIATAAPALSAIIDPHPTGRDRSSAWRAGQPVAPNQSQESPNILGTAYANGKTATGARAGPAFKLHIQGIKILNLQSAQKEKGTAALPHMDDRTHACTPSGALFVSFITIFPLHSVRLL
jgi:hypothetical protein